MSSIEHDCGGGEANARQEVAGGLVVAGGDAPELLQFCEEVFDQVTRLVDLSVIVPDGAAVFLGRDNRCLCRLRPAWQ